VAVEAIDGRKRDRLSGATLPRETRRRSVFRMPVYLPQPECEVDPHPGLRRSGVLAGDQASVEGAFPVVADRPRSVENVARASGAVAAGGRESGNRSGAGMASGEPVKNL